MAAMATSLMFRSSSAIPTCACARSTKARAKSSGSSSAAPSQAEALTRSDIVATPIDFYFDFSSPYGYLASQKIEALAAKHGRAVDWHPILLGVIFKQTGTVPLTEIPLKGDYARRDFERSARFHGLPKFTMPSRFPIPSQAPARIVLWQKVQDPAMPARLVKAYYRAFSADDIDISGPDNAVAVAAKEGIDAAAARAAIDDPAIK